MAAPQVLLYNPTGGNAYFGAPGAYWSSLRSALNQNTDILAGRSVILNAAGSALVATDAPGFGTTGFGGEPQDVISLVQSGYVWIDWCAWPMAYRYFLLAGRYVGDAAYDGLNGSKLAIALNQMGVNLTDTPAGANAQFASPVGTTLARPNGTNFPYPTAIVCNQAPTSLPSNVILPPAGELTSGQYGFGYSPDGSPQYAYPLMAVAYGKGVYVYAFASDTLNTVGRLDGVHYSGGVSPADLAGFLAGILSPTPIWQSATGGGSTVTQTGQQTTITPPSLTAPPPGTKPATPSTSSTLVRYLEYAGAVAGLVVVGAAWYDYKLHEVSAPHETVVVNR